MAQEKHPEVTFSLIFGKVGRGKATQLALVPVAIKGVSLTARGSQRLMICAGRESLRFLDVDHWVLICNLGDYLKFLFFFFNLRVS